MSFSDWTKKRKKQNEEQETTQQGGTGARATASPSAAPSQGGSFSEWTRQQTEGGTLPSGSGYARDDKPSSFSEWTRKNKGVTAWRDEEVGFNDWLDNLNRFSQRMSTEYADRDGKYQNADTLGAYRDSAYRSIDSFTGKAADYRNYFQAYRSMYDEMYGEGTVDRILSALDEGGSYLEGLRGGLGSEYDYWAQFKDEDDYNTYQRGKEYAALADAADFAEKSRYVSTYQPGTEKFNAWSGTYTNSGFGDIAYDYINRDETARSRQALADIQSNASLLGLDNSERGEMTDNEIAIFNYIYATQSPEAAYEYIDYLTGDLNYRQRAKAEEEWAAYASEHPVGSSVFSVLESPLKGLSYLGQTADYLEDGKIDQNAGYNKFSYLNSAIRNEVTGIVEDKWGGVGSFAYQTGMSMGDFLFNTAVTGGNQALTLAIMGTGAAADATISAKDRGLSDNQAFALGTIAGAAEIITEKVSLEALLDKTSLTRSALGYFLKNTLAEGSEEVGSDIINLVADILIAKDKSEWQQSIDAYKSEGMDETEAFWHSVLDQAQTMGLDFLGGAVSGGVMSGGAIGINMAGNAINTRQTGAEFQAMGEDVVQAIIQEGLASDPSTQSYQLAQQLQQKLDGGGTITNAELGRLYQANVQAIDAEEGSGDLLLRAAEELTQKGRVTNNTALDILDNPSARATLEAEAGLSITEEMSKAQQRKAVKSAVETLASREGGVSTEVRETGRDGAAEAQRSAQTTTQAAPRQVSVAQQAHNIQSMSRAAQALGQQGAKIAKDFYDGTTDTTAYYGAFSAYYQAGVSGMDMDKVRNEYGGQLNEAQKYAAYAAGQNDAAVSLARERRAAQFAKVAGTDSGLVFDDYVESSMDTAMADRVNSVAKTLGVRVSFVDSVRGGTANAQISGSDILVEKNNPNPVMFLLGHEWTHRMQELAPDQYRTFRDAVAAETQGEARVLLDQYRRAGEDISYEAALDEAAANYAGRMIEDGKVLDDFIEKHRDDRTLLEKVRDAIRSIIAKLTGAERRQAQTAEGRLTAALEAAAKRASTLQGEGSNDTITATRNSMKEDGEDGQEGETGGRPGTGSREGYGQSTDREGKGQDGRVRGELSAASGRHGGVNPSFGAKPVRSWAEGRTVKPAKGSVAYTEQQTAAGYGVPSFVVADAVWAENKGGTPAFSAGGQIYFRETMPEKNRGMFAPHEITHVMRQVGYKPYLDFLERTPTMLNMSDQMTRVLLNHVAEHQHTTMENADPARLYDEFNATMYGHIAAGKTDMFTEGPAAHVFHDFAAYAKELGELHEGFKAENRKETKFSLKAPVEETDKLLALHNLTEKNLRDALRLGGLPMPSIAIVQAQQGHAKYGEISLVFSKDTIDPQADRRNKVYGGDAWTPTAPTVDRVVNDKVARRFSNEVYEKAQKIADGMFLGDASAALYFENEYTSKTMDNILDGLSHNDGVRAAYLADQGKTLDAVMRDKVEQFDSFGNEALSDLAERMGAQELAAAYARTMTGEGLTDGDISAVKEAVRGALERRSGFAVNSPAKIELRLNRLTSERMTRFIQNAWDLREAGGGSVEQEVDRYATSYALRDMVDQDDLRLWLEQKLDGLLGEAGIYNGKDPFTPSGNRRGFAALHNAYTLENIVKAMTSQQAERGEGTWGASAKTMQSVSTPSYRNIKEIKADSGRLGAVEGDAYEARVEAVDQQIGAIIQKVKATNKAHSDNSFIESDIIGGVLMETAKGKHTVDAIMRAFSEEGYKISSQTAQDIQAVYKAAAELPTEYFEAKPRRAVGFDEVLAAVVPDDLDAELRTEAESAGMRLLEYKTGDDADRLEKVNSVEGARFSIKEDSQGRELTEAQQEYFQGSRAVDAEGRLLTMYHGTRQGGFTVFRGWSYLTANKDYAAKYVNRDTGDTMYEVYAAIRNPFDTRIPECRELFASEYTGNYSNTPLQESGLPDWTDGYDLVDFIEENGYGYDAILLDEGADPATGERIISYVVRNPEQIKNTTNKNPTADPDIRRSLKGSEDAGNIAALREENDLLRERVDYWRGQTRRTERVTTDKKAVASAARQLIQSYGADIALEDIQGDLQSLYDYLASGYDGKDELTYTEARRRAEAIAQRLVESAVAVDDEMYQQYKDLRSYLRTTRLTLSEADSRDITDYGDFRRRNMGRMNLGKGNTNIDQVYQEMSTLWPEFFDEQRESNPADQLLHIAEVLDGIYDIAEYNPFSRYMEQAVTGAANEIMETFFDLPQTRKTFADRQAMKLQEAKAKGRAQVQKVREQSNAKLEALREQNRERVQRAIERERSRRDTQIGQLKERYAAKDAAGRERRSAAELRRKITRHTKALSQKLLRPTDKQHIPESLRGPVAAMLESINQESAYSVDTETGKRRKGDDGLPTKRTEAFRALKEQYAKIIAEGGDMVIDPSLLGSDAEGIRGSFDAVIAMKDTRLADMTTAQLETVWQVVKAVEHSVSTAGKVLSQAKYARTADWAQALSIGTGSRRAKTSLTRSHALIDLETPYTFFSHYGEAGHAVYRTLRNAQDQQQLMVERVAEEAGKIVDPKTVKALEEATHTFTTERGETLTLSTAQVMELYELMKRKQAEDHLLKGGIVQPEIKSAKIRRGTDAILLTAGDLATITGTLTDKQVQIADGLQGLTTGLLADYGNQASMTAYGYKKFTGTDYWPIKSAKEGIHSTVERGGNNTRSIQNIGLAKTTMPHASNPLDLAGIFSAFSAHAADMTDYAAWLCTMEDLNRLYNFKFRDGEGNLTGKTIKGLLDRVGGTGAQKYWNNLMEDIQNGINAPSDSPSWDIIGRGIGSFKGAAVGANLRVVIQQPTAFFRAGAVLSPADLSRGLARGVTRGNGWSKALQYSPIAKRKDMGGFDISSPRQMSEILFDSRTRVRKLNDALSAPAGMADAITWGRLWNACEWATAREHKELTKGSEAFYKAVNELFTEVIDQTQVVDGVLQRSNIMRSSNAVVKQATSFMGEPIMSLNLLMRTYDQVRYEQDSKKRGRAIKTMGRAATALVVTNIVNALAQSLIDAMRDDDEDKKYWERFRAAFTGITGEEESAWDKAVAAVFNGNVGSNMNLLGQIPFVKDALSMLQGYDVSRTEMEIIADLIEAGQTAAQSAGGAGKKTRAYAAKELLAAGAKVFGIPVGNLARDMWGLARSITVETDNIPLQYEMEKAIYNISNSGNKGRYYDILFRALVQGDMDSYQHINDPASTKDARVNGDPQTFKSQVKYYWWVDARKHNADNTPADNGKDDFDMDIKEVRTKLTTCANTGDTPSEWAKEATDYCKKKGIFCGDGNGNYGWQQPITREATAQIIYNLLENIGMVDKLPDAD